LSGVFAFRAPLKHNLQKQNFLTFHYVQILQLSTTASYAMLGDINIAEPGALIDLLALE
jgi:acetyl-CoA carboxylase beta subunit